MRTTTSGFTTVMMSVRYFDIERAGVYQLLVTGIAPASDLSAVALIFTRPYAGALFLLIISIVFGAICLIGGLVFSTLRYTGKL